MEDGIIEPAPDSEFGYTADLYDGYLWKMGNSICICFIISKFPNQGNFKKLVENILDQGFIVKITTPLGRMKDIVIKNGYKKTMEFASEFDEYVDVWIKFPPTKPKA
jgi:hypothetical protein